MTTKTKFSIFAVAGIVAIVAMASGFILDDNNQTTLSQTEKLVMDGEPKTVSKPHEYTHWTGVPILESSPASMDRDEFHLVKSGQYDWLDRAIENGNAIATTDELQEWDEVSDGNYYFKVDGTMYTIHYSTAKVNLENDYIRVFPLDNPSQNSRSVSTDLIEKGLDDPYNWVQISNAQANEYFNLKVDGSEFKTSNGDVRLQYIGKLSPESSSLDYKSIVDRSAGKIMGDHDE